MVYLLSIVFVLFSNNTVVNITILLSRHSVHEITSLWLLVLVVRLRSNQRDSFSWQSSRFKLFQPARGKLPLLLYIYIFYLSLWHCQCFMRFLSFNFSERLSFVLLLTFRIVFLPYIQAFCAWFSAISLWKSRYCLSIGFKVFIHLFLEVVRDTKINSAITTALPNFLWPENTNDLF